MQKSPCFWGLKATEIYFLMALEARRSRLGHQQRSASGAQGPLSWLPVIADTPWRPWFIEATPISAVFRWPSSSSFFFKGLKKKCYLSIYLFAGQGLNLCPLEWMWGALTAGPQGKSQSGLIRTPVI